MKPRPRLAALLFSVLATFVNAADTRPNILVIVADDLGISDLGAFGGEIATPNLDQLAKQGLRFSQFHTAAACSPTRAMLMTGTDHHIAGIANMSELMTPEQRGKPGYEGGLNERVVTVAELLRDAGYATLMSGKWHLGVTQQQNPAQRGFARSFALLQAGHNHFGKPDLPPPELGGVAYTENGKPAQLPKDFYSSDYFTDKLLEYLRADAAADKPFFAYLPFTAPHWPLQAPAASIEKYKGRYAGGWEVLRRERIARQRELGLLPANSDTSAPHTMGNWNALSAEAQQRKAREMEIYAAMVDRLDWNVGRVLDYLRSSGKLDNTVIVFLSDNGAEGANAAHTLRMLMGGNLAVPTLEQLGTVDSLASYGANWAQAAMSPRRLYKAVSTEGGISSPAFIRFPGFARQQQISTEFATAMDIMPTLLDVAQGGFPQDGWHGKPIAPMRGKSMLPFLMKRSENIHDSEEAVGWELFGQRALRQGSWKITFVSPPNGSGHWELYDLARDPGERHDVSKQFPKVAKKLLESWDSYSKDMGIILHEQVVSPYTDQ
jgi:arylsulfatase A-like enzyme